MTKVRYALEDNIATIVLNDVATMNSAGLDMVDELIAALRRAAKEARAVLLTGEGRGFCSGASTKSDESAEMAARADGDLGVVVERYYNPLANMLRNLPVPLVTAVNGAAVGVGCSIALSADIIVASESAYFLWAFRPRGVVPDGGSTYLLPRLVGRARASELMLLGERLPAATALSWGMINRCVPGDTLLETARELALNLATGPASLQFIRQLTWDSLDHSWREQLAQEREMMGHAARTADYHEARMARREKRIPSFAGR
jgi:2-(1,2-epoxy-1,2-dihydrophenyl)acetyl-CoA isomerase